MYSKYYESKKAKTTYILERMEYVFVYSCLDHGQLASSPHAWSIEFCSTDMHGGKQQHIHGIYMPFLSPYVCWATNIRAYSVTTVQYTYIHNIYVGHN